MNTTKPNTFVLDETNMEGACPKELSVDGRHESDESWSSSVKKSVVCRIFTCLTFGLLREVKCKKEP